MVLPVLFVNANTTLTTRLCECIITLAGRLYLPNLNLGLASPNYFAISHWLTNPPELQPFSIYPHTFHFHWAHFI